MQTDKPMAHQKKKKNIVTEMLKVCTSFERDSKSVQAPVSLLEVTLERVHSKVSSSRSRSDVSRWREGGL